MRSYSVYQRFGQSLLGYCGLILGLNKSQILTVPPKKIFLTINVVKSNINLVAFIKAQSFCWYTLYVRGKKSQLLLWSKIRSEQLWWWRKTAWWRFICGKILLLLLLLINVQCMYMTSKLIQSNSVITNITGPAKSVRYNRGSL